MPNNVTKQKPEITVEEFIEKYANTITSPDTEEKEECRSDLRSVIRRELIKYDKWVCLNHEKLLNIPTSEQAVDEFLKDNQ